ncbi:MAG TPA: membrane protein insertion efficiency factor YidD [Campylobacteraceae bacterium]|nr:membrane protein insertion efficiency factor YidD [Campylobacteraceae bacterium]HHD83743.1 membrane protein insertion efficiency factor YidD [Campylobacteraceae bacterium]
MRKTLLSLLFLYQRFFTLLGYGSCRYYPTCSEYAKWQFQKNSLPKAFILSSLRILRCNQLFPGGIDYPVVKVNLNLKRIYSHNRNTNKIIVQFWLVPKEGNYFYLIKTFKRK